MYSVVKSVIESRNYELSDMLTKIDTLWVQGSITEEERAELIDLARQNAEVQQSIDILVKLEELDKRVRAIEDMLRNGEDTEGETEGETEEGTEEATYPEYVAGTWYHNGKIVTFEGKTYKCIAPEGATCVWSPAEYPAYWEVFVKDAPLTEDTESDAPLTE